MTELYHIIFYSLCIIFIIICIIGIYIYKNSFNKYTSGILLIFISSTTYIGYLIFNKLIKINDKKIIGSNNKIEIHPVLKALDIDIALSKIDDEYKDEIIKVNTSIDNNKKKIKNINDMQIAISDNLKN